jgi:hypothetical protein
MGGSLWIGFSDAADNWVRYEYRAWDGKWGKWTEAGLFNWDTRDNSHARRNQTKYIEKEMAVPGVTKVEFRFTFRSLKGGPHGAGANLLRMEVDYPPADPAPKPVEVTYNWTEYYEPLHGEEGGIARTHTEVVPGLPYSYSINVGGDIAPRMNWVRTALAGANTATGYSDGRDVGTGYAIPQVRYERGKLLSFRKSYTVSVPPASDGFSAEGDGGELTDGVVKEPQVEGPSPRWAGPASTPFTAGTTGSRNRSP